MVIIHIIFNVLVIASLACLIKPSLIEKYTGEKPISRWVFLIALLVLVSVKQAVFDPPFSANSSMTESH